MRNSGVTILLAASLGACSAARPVPPAKAAAPDWRTIATPEDRDRLRGWRDAWTSALAKARTSGASSSIAAQGALLRYDEALADPLPPAGNYRCRTIKLGAKSSGLLDYSAYPYFACRVARGGRVTSLTKLTGSQRQVGLILPAEPRRAVFLGTLMLGDESRTAEYGRDRTRDVAGWVERVNAARWRVAMPYPAFESTLDVLELVPAK